MYSLNPDDHKVTNGTIFEWRQYLKLQLLEQRRYMSDYSGERLQQADMHEGILTRANVPKSVWWHYKLYSPFNCFLVTREEHQKYGHLREWALQKSYARYGRGTVREWFYKLPWKGKPPFQLL